MERDRYIYRYISFFLTRTPAEPALCNLLGTRKFKGTAPGGPRRRRPRSGLAGGARGAAPPEAQDMLSVGHGRSRSKQRPAGTAPGWPRARRARSADFFEPFFS